MNKPEIQQSTVYSCTMKGVLGLNLNRQRKVLGGRGEPMVATCMPRPAEMSRCVPDAHMQHRMGRGPFVQTNLSNENP